MPLRAQEREAHRAADHHHVGHRQEALDHRDLVRDLRAADDRHERVPGVLEDPGQRLDLAFEQPSGRARQQVCDALGARMRAVCHAEGIVDVEIRQRRELPRELGIVARLSRLEAHVLEHQYVAVAQLLHQRRDLVADHRRRQRHLRARQLAQAIRHRRERQLRRAFAFWSAQMGDQHQACAARAQLFDRRQRRGDARVVADERNATGRGVAVRSQRHVEVHAHEHSAAVHVQVVNAPHR